jgi:uncharacterized membrane protein
MRSNQTITSKAVILAGLFFLCLFTASNAFAYDYQVTEIQPPAGYTASRAMGINNLGEVVGRFYNIDPATGEAVNRKAFVWDRTNGASLLVTLAGEASAWAINDNGFVAGYSYNAAGKQRAALWDLQEGTVDDIGALRNTSTGVNGESSTAYGINNLDQVVGNADIPNDTNTFTPFHAFLDDTSGIGDLGTLNTTMPEYEYGYSIAYDVNNNGQVVGIAQDSPWGAFIYDDTNGMRHLQKDPAYADDEWYAVVINDSGLIGGHVIAAENQSLPFYWPNESSAPVRITMPAGFPYGEIYGINASGQMVGIMWSSDQAGATEHAFLFDQRHGVKDLNDLIASESGWVLGFARDINDNGKVVGYGLLNGEKRGFVLDPAECLGVSFGPIGLYYYSSGAWVKLNANSPDSMVGESSILYASFSGHGLYRFDGIGWKWKRLNAKEAVKMCLVGADLYVDFGSGVGLYKYDGSKWSRINSGQPEMLLGVGSDLYADFGAGVGLYKYDGSAWKKMNPNDTTKMVAVGNALYAHFAGAGLYRYDGNSWKKIHDGQPQQMLGVGTDLYADFGAGVGLYKYDGSAWKKINSNDTTKMVAVGNALYVHFSGVGLYKYDGVTWEKVNPGQPQRMVGVGTELYADFGAGVGLYRYDGLSWERINPNETTDMIGLSFE